MTKVENIKRRVFLKEQAMKVDTLLATALKYNQPAIDCEWVDTVFRPFSMRVAAARFDNENSQAITDATVNLISGMMVELICSLVELNQPKLAVEFGQTLLNEVAVSLKEGLEGVYATKQ